MKIEVITRTTTKFLSLLLSCVALGSDTQGTHKEQNLLFVRHARGRKLESGVQKNRSIKPKIRWKAKGLPDVWQGQHQVLEVQQAIKKLSFSTENFGFPGFSFGFCYKALTYQNPRGQNPEMIDHNILRFDAKCLDVKGIEVFFGQHDKESRTSVRLSLFEDRKEKQFMS